MLNSPTQKLSNRRQTEELISSISQSRPVTGNKNYEILYPESKNKQNKDLKTQIKDIASKITSKPTATSSQLKKPETKAHSTHTF